MQSTRHRGVRMLVVLAAAFGLPGVLASQASAHAHVFPHVVQAEESNPYTLVVPNETEDADTVEVKLEVPTGLLVGSFEPAPGWKRTTEDSGEAVSTVTWTGKGAPGEAAYFRFTGRPAEDAPEASEYTFKIIQTYSDGKVSEWVGPEDSDEPASVVSVADLVGQATGGQMGAAEPAEADDDGTDTLTIVALVLAALALVLAIAAMARRGSRELT